MKNSNVNMLSGPITKSLLSLSIPIMIMNVMQNLFNIVDMTALRYFSDDMSVGAVGTCASLITLCTSLLIGLSAGANVIVANRIGSGDKERTSKAVMTSILLSVAGGLLMMAIGVIFAATFLKMANCPDTLLQRATVYFRIYFLGVPILMLYNFCASILRATGDTKKPMYYLIIGGTIKAVLTIFFLTIFDMDVEGVAYSTIISNLITSSLALRALLKSPIISINLKKIKFDLTELKQILFIGIPTGLQSAMFSVANVIIMSVVNSFGENATTGISIANQIDGILYQIIKAPSFATMPYISQNIGAGNIKRVKQTIVRAVLITTAFGAVFGSLSAFFSRELSSIMTSTPEVIAYARQKILIISSTYFLAGINEIMGDVLKSMGRPILPTIATMAYMCLFRFVWVYVIYPVLPQNFTFLYLVWPTGWLLSIITLLIAFFPTISKLQKRLLN